MAVLSNFESIMARIFFLAIVFYLVYRLIFDLIVPVVKTTRQVKQRFSNMQQPGSNAGTQPPPKQRPDQDFGRHPKGDYIEFEEVKKS